MDKTITVIKVTAISETDVAFVSKAMPLLSLESQDSLANVVFDVFAASE